jgi:hypothetical protein
MRIELAQQKKKCKLQTHITLVTFTILVRAGANMQKDI